MQTIATQEYSGRSATFSQADLADMFNLDIRTTTFFDSDDILYTMPDDPRTGPTSGEWTCGIF